MKTERILKSAALVILLALLVGCAAQKSYRRAERDTRRENWDAAVLGYSKAVALDPGNSRYSMALQQAKLRAASDHFAKGRRYADSVNPRSRLLMWDRKRRFQAVDVAADALPVPTGLPQPSTRCVTDTNRVTPEAYPPGTVLIDSSPCRVR